MTRAKKCFAKLGKLAKAWSPFLLVALVRFLRYFQILHGTISSNVYDVELYNEKFMKVYSL